MNIESKKFSGRTKLRTYWYSWVVEARNSEGVALFYYEERRAFQGPWSQRKVTKQCNQVASKLYEMCVRTGLEYEWMWYGPSENMPAFLRERKIKLS